MMVTFISECEKKALNRTRRVLDAFANRIGSRTWQTVITEEGLRAVKKLLKKTATKNTAVSCHWIRSRSRSELLWIVGNREKFNTQGIVPVNVTQKTIMNLHWENDWHYLPLIKALTALAALFHDWGKASEFFQDKLKQQKIIADPLRHEWISTLFLNAYVDGQKDEQWLARLAKGDFEIEIIKKKAAKNKKKPLAKLPVAASLLAWLIVSHHRLPEKDMYRGIPANRFQELFNIINNEWGYVNRWDEMQYEQDLLRCFEYPHGLPSNSKVWLKQAKKWAKRLYGCLQLMEQSTEDGSWRLILHHSRLALMLGDHYYSSCEADVNWQTELDLYANTDRKSGGLKQRLDEHLVGVAKNALKITHLLPAFESVQTQLPHAFDIITLQRKSPGKFRWQDIAVSKIIAWREALPKAQPSSHFGFFAINMASTGQGKTFANAKVMRALSADKESLRYILALGLRTLTLQTGDEYRHRIGLDETELAVLIGSRAVMDLYKRNQILQEQKLTDEDFGSESQTALLDNEIDYETEIPEDVLSTLFPETPEKQKNRQFLYAPVLACTIDHMMAATETKRGGRFILPCLRLMSSDLVIDEIDDFDGKDLLAIGRLVHLAGMLGRKVMISSATIPPDLAEGYFNAYQCGWSVFKKTRDVNNNVACAWIDEFTTQVANIAGQDSDQIRSDFRLKHQQFIGKRIKNLKKQPAKRKAELIECQSILDSDAQQESKEQQYYGKIQHAIIEQHKRHNSSDSRTRKQVSFGVVRVANISPCIDLTSYLAETAWPENTEIRVMAYHSQQILIMRSVQEAHLDSVLKRDKNKQQAVFENGVIRNHLNRCRANNLIFILVATPVEEVGRDHDFDWAVIEPSSFRSIIQLAGRVLRHRAVVPEKPNLTLMQYNLKGLLGESPAFSRPGYETGENSLITHDLGQLVDLGQLTKSVDAIPRIQRNEMLEPECNLIDLEHHSIHQLLTQYDRQGPEALQGWLTGCWWLTGLPQYFNPFREGYRQQNVYVVPGEDGWRYVEKFIEKGRMMTRQTLYRIKTEELSEAQKRCLWLDRDYSLLLEEIAEEKGISVQNAALVYGELILPTYGKGEMDIQFCHSLQLGLHTEH